MLPSRYLPPDFATDKPLVLIAGKGIYPKLVAERARAAGLTIKIIGFEDETEPSLLETVAEHSREVINVGQLGKLLKTLKRFDAGSALMAGQITPKKLFHGLQPDLKAVLLLAKLKEKNADTIFGGIANEISDIGVTMLDARSFMDHHMATSGVMTRGKFPVSQDYIEHGLHIARECARLNIGQGCVVRKGTVLAVEAFEGTDKMLLRAGEFKTDQAMFVKTVKTGQDYRFDVPCFGMQTLEKMYSAGIFNAVLEAGRVIILEKDKVIDRANELKINLLGVS